MDINQQSTINIQEKSNLIWNIADLLRDYYKPHEYGKVILPMTVIKRFNDTLAPTRQKVWDTYEKVKHLQVKDGFLTTASGYQFYNTSPYDFQKLVDDPDNIEQNFNAFINGFSDNVIDILKNFEFSNEITKLANGGMLYLVIEEFNKKEAYMGPDVISTVDMGYIFEELVRRFSESYDEDAGEHFTSRDIIYLMTDLLLAEDKEMLINEGVAKTVYDMTMGTSQMLTCMSERLHQLDKEANVLLFGQELNPETYAIAKADMLIRGGNSNNMKKGNTLTNDQFKGFTFDYIISNPPFGRAWKVEQKKVKDEHNLGDNGRFGVGLPKVSDGQMLFDLNGISKLKDTGKMAIIHNGSSLFTGAAGSGESEIRRYMIENDWLDCIVQLSTDVFYNTGITTYIWIISKDKPIHRQGKIQLIDASKMVESRRKNIGNKRYDITEECRNIIVKAYGEFKNNAVYEDNGKTCESKIFNNEDLGFNRITIESPQYDSEGNIITKGKKKSPIADASKRDYENVPLTQDIDDYFECEIKPYNKDAWIDKSKTKVGYEIPFTRYFYKYEELEDSTVIAARLKGREQDIMNAMLKLFMDGES
ncbi:MAG: type I restriction-modification system subunit M [Erysipelotrichaceae bacterium]|nr:type I restriction-modification system subunit M [Erysipelotrichaceae bacterium]